MDLFLQSVLLQLLKWSKIAESRSIHPQNMIIRLAQLARAFSSTMMIFTSKSIVSMARRRTHGTAYGQCCSQKHHIISLDWYGISLSFSLSAQRCITPLGGRSRSLAVSFLFVFFIFYSLSSSCSCSCSCTYRSLRSSHWLKKIVAYRVSFVNSFVHPFFFHCLFFGVLPTKLIN